MLKPLDCKSGRPPLKCVRAQNGKTDYGIVKKTVPKQKEDSWSSPFASAASMCTELED